MTIIGTFPETDCKHVVGSPMTESFTERMRFHQSWYRHHVLKRPPGPNPHARGALYGNMLRKEDGDQGLNFLTPDIFDQARKRFPFTSQSTETRRLYTNLLGSQSMCFNLFGPLARDNQLATRLLDRLPGFPEDAHVSRIRFEYAPAKADHLNDATSFDAFIEYQRDGGKQGFVGIETKLTEPFSQKDYTFVERYDKWMQESGWWWKQTAEKQFSTKLYNQLWRNQLLAFAICHQKVPAYTEGCIAVVYPRGDMQCSDAIQKYRKHLLPDGEQTLLEWQIEDVLAVWKPCIDGDLLQSWMMPFEQRYIDLSTSEPDWQMFRSASYEQNRHQ
jgi:hypothetical protein